MFNPLAEKYSSIYVKKKLWLQKKKRVEEISQDEREKIREEERRQALLKKIQLASTTDESSLS